VPVARAMVTSTYRCHHVAVLVFDLGDDGSERIAGRIAGRLLGDNHLGGGGGGNREAIRGRGGQAAVGDGKREGSGRMKAQRTIGGHTIDRADILGAQERARAAGQGDGDFRAVGGDDVAVLDPRRRLPRCSTYLPSHWPVAG